MNLTLHPVQRAARALADLQTARFEIMAMGGSPSSPLTQQAILLSHMLARANDAIKYDFTRIVDGKLPRYDVVLRDKETGELVDPASGVSLNLIARRPRNDHSYAQSGSQD